MTRIRVEVVRAALEEIAASGPLTPPRVIEAASDPDHPLHVRFEWDDSKAAHEYRLDQARHIIREVRVTPIGASRSVPIFVHVPTPGGEGEYVAATIVARQPERWALARDEVLAHLDAAKENISDLEDILRLYGPPRPEVGKAARTVELAREQVAEIRP